MTNAAASAPLIAVHALAASIWAGGLAGEVEEADTEVLVLAPARAQFLDRWLSDSDPAYQEWQRSLVLTLATLAKADIAAAAHVGDGNLVQAVEDELRTFPATVPPDGDRSDRSQ